MFQKLAEKYFRLTAKAEPYMIIGGAGVGAIFGAFTSIQAVEPSFSRTTMYTVIGGAGGIIGGFLTTYMFPVAVISTPFYGYHKYKTYGQDRNFV
jgi:hypothetical protein